MGENRSAFSLFFIQRRGEEWRWMVRRNGMWLTVVATLVSILALGVALLAGVRSAVGRAFDLAEYKAASPYYQTLALREQVVENGRGNGVLWVVGGILLVFLAGWLLAQATPFLREARLSYKAVMRQDSRPRRATRRSYYADDLPTLPPQSRLRMLPDGNQPETVVYEEMDDVDDVDRQGWIGTGYRR